MAFPVPRQVFEIWYYWRTTMVFSRRGIRWSWAIFFIVFVGLSVKGFPDFSPSRCPNRLKCDDPSVSFDLPVVSRALPPPVGSQSLRVLHSDSIPCRMYAIYVPNYRVEHTGRRVSDVPTENKRRLELNWFFPFFNRRPLSHVTRSSRITVGCTSWKVSVSENRIVRKLCCYVCVRISAGRNTG